MRLRTALSVVGDIRHQLITPNSKALFKPHKNDLFFRGGWGSLQKLDKLKNRRQILADPEQVEIKWQTLKREEGFTSYMGHFESPFDQKHLPECAHSARVRWIVPKNHDKSSPLCLIFPMTGDQSFRLRENTLALPLLKKNISCLLLEAPFYGARKPKYQKSFLIHTVEDILSMCVAMAEEGRSLLSYFQSAGYDNLGVAGISQGGMISMIVGATNPFPLSIAMSLGPHSPEVIFTDGLLRNFVDWEALGLEGPKSAVEIFKDYFQMGNIFNLPQPHAESFAIVQGAKRDLVVPQHSVQQAMDHWPLAKRHWLKGTHMSSLALHNKDFQKLIYFSFKKRRLLQ